MNKYLVRNFKWIENLGKVPAKVYRLGSGLIFLQNWRRRPHFPIKLVAAASFFNKIGGGGKDLATLLAAVLTWSGYWLQTVW